MKLHVPGVETKHSIGGGLTAIIRAPDVDSGRNLLRAAVDMHRGEVLAACRVVAGAVLVGIDGFEDLDGRWTPELTPGGHLSAESSSQIFPHLMAIFNLAQPYIDATPEEAGN